jgi:hypothetical protein
MAGPEAGSSAAAAAAAVGFAAAAVGVAAVDDHRPGSCGTWVVLVPVAGVVQCPVAGVGYDVAFAGVLMRHWRAPHAAVCLCEGVSGD